MMHRIPWIWLGMVGIGLLAVSCMENNPAPSQETQPGSLSGAAPAPMPGSVQTRQGGGGPVQMSFRQGRIARSIARRFTAKAP